MALPAERVNYRLRITLGKHSSDQQNDVCVFIRTCLKAFVLNVCVNESE